MKSNFLMQLQHETAAAFAAANPILPEGEMVYETDTNKIKIGDGETRYNLLPYASGSGAGSFKYGLYRLSGAQTSNLAIGNHIEFDMAQGSLGGLSTGTGQQRGIITLKGGKSYKIIINLSTLHSAMGFLTAYIYDRTHNQLLGQPVLAVTYNHTGSTAHEGCAPCIISPASDIDIEVRMTDLLALNGIDYLLSNVLIEEYGGY